MTSAGPSPGGAHMAERPGAPYMMSAQQSSLSMGYSHGPAPGGHPGEVLNFMPQSRLCRRHKLVPFFADTAIHYGIMILSTCTAVVCCLFWVNHHFLKFH